MTLSLDVLTEPAQFEALAPAWSLLVRESPADCLGLDMTNGPVWFAALRAACEPAQAARVLTLHEGDKLVGVLPLVVEGRAFGGAQLMSATELYGGRSGFVLIRDDPDLLEALLRGVHQAFGAWTTLRVTSVRDSANDRLLAQVLPRLGWTAVRGEGCESPWFPLRDDAATFEAGVSKSLRQTLRTATNKLRTLGELRAIELTDLQREGRAIDVVLAIERASWKHGAGTAITCHPYQERFYRALFPRALQAGILAGQVLFLGDEPIAHNVGLVRDGTYCCLKHSNTDAHNTMSPAQVLNRDLILSLRSAGVRTYDFMGKAEPHKLRWSSETGAYFRQAMLLYNNGAAAQLTLAVRRLAARMRRRPAPEAAHATAAPE